MTSKDALVRWFVRYLSLALAAILGFSLLSAAPLATAQTTFFHDDFETGSASRWSPDDGSWDVVAAGSGHAYQQSAPDGIARAIGGDDSWDDYNLAVKITPAELASGSAGLLARYVDDQNHYAATVTDDMVALTRTVDGVESTLASAPYESGAQSLLLEVEVRGDFIKVYVDHDLIVSGTDATFTAGQVGLTTRHTPATFDDVRVSKPIELGIMRANLHRYKRFFVDRFEGDLSRWNLSSGAWEVTPAEIRNGQDGENSVVAATAGDDGVDPLALAAWDSAVRADSTTRVTVVPTDDLDGAGYASVMFRVVDQRNYYAVHLNAATVTLERTVDGGTELIEQRPTDVELEPGKPLYVEIDAYGAELDVYLDNAPALSASDATFTEGRIALGAHDTTVYFDDIETNDKFDQFALLDKIKETGINRARLTYTREKYLREASGWIKYANEIDLEVLMSFSFTGDPQYYPLDAERVPGLTSWDAYRMSDIDLRLYGKAYRKFLRHLRAERAELTAVGLGNEINWHGFNGDLRDKEGPWIFDLDTDITDPEFARIRTGIEKYGKLIAKTRKITETMFRQEKPEIVSAGLNHPYRDGVMSGKAVTVRPALFLSLLQGSHQDQPADAPNYLSMLDQIGLHFYPFAHEGLSYDVDPETSYQSTLFYVTTIMDPIIETIGSDYTFLVAEAGSYRQGTRTKQGTVITEQQRLDLYRLFVRALQDPRLAEVNFGPIQMYSWDDRQWAIYQDDELLPIGRIFTEYPY